MVRRTSTCPETQIHHVGAVGNKVTTHDMDPAANKHTIPLPLRQAMDRDETNICWQILSQTPAP